MIEKVGFIDKSNDDAYNKTINSAAETVIKEYNNFIMEAVYYQLQWNSVGKGSHGWCLSELRRG